MLSILGPNVRCCGLGRRQFLSFGGTGLLGLSLPRVLAAQEQTALAGQASPRPRAKSVIFLFLFGGPSQLETFDMKPGAPDTIRGPFKPIACRTPGLLISEHLPKTAAISDRVCVLRTLTHPYNDHSSAGHYIQTGHPWHVPIGGGFNATEKDWPAMGSIVEYVDQQAGGPQRTIPSYVYLPNRLGHLQTYSVRLDRPGQYAGWLGRGYDALATDIGKRSDTDNPFFRDCTDDELDFRIKGLAADAGLTVDRLARRQTLLEGFDAARRRLDQGRTAASYNRFQERALALVTSEATRTALDLRREPAELRDRYGRHLFGQATLLARRMVEAGARFVTVAWDAPDGYSWDSHVHSADVKNHLLPGFDQAFSSLVADLDQRGLLDETLVVAMGEMGRTPSATGQWGRNHWSTLFPAVLAGGGLRGGVVYGRSDKNAAYPVEKPIRPEDLAATIFAGLGIDPELRVADAQGRPVPLIDGAQPLTELFG
ncbi:MAG TPA: DUF1501 domain-containing protein [Pirellulales bacterium]|nr:DUF1501 domain-containing protein [Pirellulales bacterium]